MRWARSARPMRKEGRRRKIRGSCWAIVQERWRKKIKEMGWVHSGERNKKHRENREDRLGVGYCPEFAKTN